MMKIFMKAELNQNFLINGHYRLINYSSFLIILEAGIKKGDAL